jgi:hypothetical protein
MAPLSDGGDGSVPIEIELLRHREHAEEVFSPVVA